MLLCFLSRSNMAENMKMEVETDETDANETLPEEENEEKMEAGLEEGNDSSDSEDSDDNDAVINPRIQQLELQVVSNPYHYDSHLELIKLLRESGDLDKVRNAREGMSKIFPLTQELWSEWLKDEIPLACIPEQREKVIALFERAVKDYQSVQLWILYCQFMMDIMEGEVSLQGVRATFEKAIVAAGLHVTEGSSIWEGYREFEKDILESLEQMLNEENRESMTEKISTQKERVMSIFKRQLAVPLLGMQATMREFEDWIEDPVPEPVKIAYDKALAKLEECLPYEDTLASAQAPKTTEYKSYLEYELKKGDPARIQCLYERAMKENCLVGDMWTEYTSYLDSTLKITAVVIPVHERAVRNCPWVSLLWQNYIRALERNKKENNIVKEILETALRCGFSASDDYLQLWHCYCDYSRRKVDDWSEESQQVKDLRETFKTATEYLQNYFGKDGDPTNLLDRYWARIEAFHTKNMTECQRLWDDMIMSNHGREAEYWLEYANILRSCRDIPKCRKVLQRAVQSASDNPEMVVQALLSFEREEGTLEDWDAAFSRCRVQLLRVNERRQKAAEKEVNRVKAEEEAQEKRKIKNAERKAAKKAEQKKAKMEMKKRKASDQGIAEESNQKPKQSEGDSGEPAAKKLHVEITQGTSTEQALTAEHSQDSATEANTVYVGNLLLSIEEERLKEVFSPLGEITEVRLKKSQAGKSRGFGYVTFKDQSSADAALAMDKTNLEGRPMNVQKAKSPKASDQGITGENEQKKEDSGETAAEKMHFETTKQTSTTEKQSHDSATESNTVYVGNLLLSLEEERLKEVFSPLGEITEVRLKKNQAGKSRGFGYVTFKDQSSVQAALAMDKTNLEGRPMSVQKAKSPAQASSKQSSEYSWEPPVKKPRGETTQGTSEDSHDSAIDPNTVFVSNLLFSVDEERLKEFFTSIGEVAEVRLMKNFLGKSKGFAYVEFKDQSSVQAALSMDRTKLDGRPVFISPSVDKSKNPTQFKFPTSLDKKTVFVTNLPFGIKESDLENLFKEHGKVNQIRLVTNRAGKPKGFGYIEYELETGASAAVVALDGTLVGDRQISVALSNPPSRRPRQPGTEQQRPKEQPGSRGRARTQLQLLPRSLHKPASASSAPAPSTTSSTPPSEEKPETKISTEPQQGFSNEYFRNLMQKKN